MVEQNPIELTLEELCTEVAVMLRAYNLLGAQADHRISEVPDGRTIRYYASLGLLDRPSVEGRQAKYGRRQLLQAVAIKALQSRGLSLSEVQSKLYGATNKEIESLLVSLANVRAASVATEVVKPVLWRELVVEPGFKIMVQDGWESTGDTLKRLRSALSSLGFSPDEGSGGSVK